MSAQHELATGEFQPRPHIQTIDQLRDHFHQPEVTGSLTKVLAYDVQCQLDQYLGVEGAREPLSLEELGSACSFLDPALPTIAIDTNNLFPGNELLGLVATEQATRANVIFIESTADHAEIVPETEDGPASLFIKGGVMILPGGEVAYGQLPWRVHADILETVDLELLEQCESLGVLTSYTKAIVEAMDDKRRLSELVLQTHVGLPERITADAFLAKQSTDNLVIKPSKGSQGTGVLITGDGSNITQTKDTFRFLSSNGYEPIVEERVKSFPFRDPETGARLDWNVRALTGYGSLLDMYVRADRWGVPVNKGRSARVIPMSEIGAYLEDPTMATILIEKLTEGASDVAQQLPDGLAGIDLAIDESLSVKLFELNAGKAGGIQTIAEFSSEREDKLSASRRLLSLMLATVPSQKKTPRFAVSTVPLQPSFGVLVTSAYRLRVERSLVDLDAETMPPNVREDRLGMMYWMLACRNANLLDVARVDAIDRALLSTFPLELPSYVPHMIGKSEFPGEYTENIAMGERLFPDDPDWPILHSTAAAAKYDLLAYQQTVREALGKGAHMERIRARNNHLIMFPFANTLDALSDASAMVTSEAIASTFSVYCTSGYEAAREYIDQQDSDMLGEGRKLIPDLRFILAVGTRHYADAFDIFAHMQKSETGLITDFVYEPTRDYLQDTAEGLLFYARLSLADGGMVVNALVKSIQFAWQMPDNDPSVEDLFAQLTELLPFEGSQDDRTQFNKLLHSLTNVGPNPDLHESLPIGALDSDIKKFSLLLNSCFTGNDTGIDEVCREFRARGLMGPDLEYYLDLLSEGPISDAKRVL